jgi:uncharacterized protein (TIGR02391 family)
MPIVIALGKAIPDAEQLLAMEPEELAAKALFLIRAEYGGGKFCPQNLRREFSNFRDKYPYPPAKLGEIDSALAESFAWLDAQGLFIIDIDQVEWRSLSRRARKFEDETDLAKFATARRFPKDALHSAMATKVWSAFLRGEFDVAVFQAMKAVEVFVRDASGFPDTLLGARLMRAAFAPKTGPLTDTNVDKGEQVARMELFAGAIGSYKNPHSHRQVPLDDPDEAAEIIMLANHLLRIVDGRKVAKASP